MLPSTDLVSRLRTITEVGVDGTTMRTWGYDWYGQDLVRINRPDGTAWRFEYKDPRFPGLMTKMILVGTNQSERLQGAWAYDAKARVIDGWQGDTVSGPNGPQPGPSAIHTTCIAGMKRGRDAT